MTHETEGKAPQQPKDDLDLIDLLVYIWKFTVKYILKPISFCIQFALRKWWILGIAAALGLGLSIGINLFWFPKYETTLSYKCRYSPADFYVSEINNVAANLPMLGYAPGERLKVEAFLYDWGDSAKTYMLIKKEIEIANKYGTAGDCFAVVGESRDSALLAGLEDKVEQHILNLRYVKVQSSEAIETMQKEIAALQVEAARLDSASQTELFAPKTIISGTGDEIEAFRRDFSISDKISSTKNRISSLERQLERNAPIELMNTPVIKKAYKLKDGITHGALLMLLVYVALMCYDYRARITKYAKGE